MSRLSALFTARKRTEISPVAAGKPDLSSSAPIDSPPPDLEDNVFSLVPQDKSSAVSEGSGLAARKPAGDTDQAPSDKSNENVHPLANADLSRLAISDDGRLYWDGKPVEVRRSLVLSPAQSMIAGIVAVFLVIGAIGAAIQASLALRDWGCRLGWTANYCGLPDKAPPRRDIPA